MTELEVLTTPGPRATCALCGREMPKTALVSKPWVTVDRRPITRFYCADGLACIAAAQSRSGEQGVTG